MSSVIPENAACGSQALGPCLFTSSLSVTCQYEPSPTTKPVETSEGLLASEDTPAFFLEETWSASWGRKKEGLLGHPCSPLPQWQPTQLSELSLSQSHLSATAIKASFCQLNHCSVGVGGFVSFISLAEFPRERRRKGICLLEEPLGSNSLLSPGSCDIVSEDKTSQSFCSYRGCALCGGELEEMATP